MLPDYYKLLQVHPEADLEMIVRAYKLLALKYHPDTNPHDPKAEEKFKALNEAYQILKDPNQRNAYDAKWNADEEGRHRDSSHDEPPRPFATPSAIDFGVTDVGTTNVRSITVTNKGGNAKNISIDWVEDFSELNFEVVPASGDDPFPLRLDISIVISELSSSGKHTASLTIDFDGQTISIPVFFTVPAPPPKTNVPRTADARPPASSHAIPSVDPFASRPLHSTGHTPVRGSARRQIAYLLIAGLVFLVAIMSLRVYHRTSTGVCYLSINTWNGKVESGHLAIHVQLYNDSSPTLDLSQLGSFTATAHKFNNGGDKPIHLSLVQDNTNILEGNKSTDATLWVDDVPLGKPMKDGDAWFRRVMEQNYPNVDYITYTGSSGHLIFKFPRVNGWKKTSQPVQAVKEEIPTTHDQSGAPNPTDKPTEGTPVTTNSSTPTVNQPQPPDTQFPPVNQVQNGTRSPDVISQAHGEPVLDHPIEIVGTLVRTDDRSGKMFYNVTNTSPVTFPTVTKMHFYSDSGRVGYPRGLVAQIPPLEPGQTGQVILSISYDSEEHNSVLGGLFGRNQGNQIFCRALASRFVGYAGVVLETSNFRIKMRFPCQ